MSLHGASFSYRQLPGPDIPDMPFMTEARLYIAFFPRSTTVVEMSQLAAELDVRIAMPSQASSQTT